MQTANLRPGTRWSRIARSPHGRGIRSEEFWASSWTDRLLALSLLFLPFQYALTIDVGFPLKISELLLAAALVSAIIGRRWQLDGPRTDGFLVITLAGFAVLSTVRALISLDPTAEVQGVRRSLVLDLLLYCAYALMVIVYWFLVRRLSVALIRDVLIQSLWLCTAAVIAQAVMLLANLPQPLEALGFDMRRRGQEWLGEQLARCGPFLEGQHLGFYGGALFVIALFSRRYVATAAAAVPVTNITRPWTT